MIPKLPTILQTANIPIIPNDECEKAIKAIEESGELFPNQMCTGPLDGTISACSVSVTSYCLSDIDISRRIMKD